MGKDHHEEGSEATLSEVARSLADQEAKLSFVDDRLVAAELVIAALVLRSEGRDQFTTDLLQWIAKLTKREGEDGRRVAQHAEDLLRVR